MLQCSKICSERNIYPPKLIPGTFEDTHTHTNTHTSIFSDRYYPTWCVILDHSEPGGTGNLISL